MSRKKKKPRKGKKYRPSVGRVHLAVGNQTIFGPLELFLHQIRHSELVYKNDRPVITDMQNSQDHDAYEVLVLFAQFIKHMGQCVNATIDVSPIMVLAELINMEFDVYDDTLTKVEAVVATGHKLCAVLGFEQLSLALDAAVAARDAYLAGKEQ